MRRVVVYVGEGCSLCEDAIEVVRSVQADVAIELTTVTIDGDPELEARYRAVLPVVEIDGERVLAYEIDPDDLRARLVA